MKKYFFHENWLNSISVVLGYVWLVSGLNKLLNGRFVTDFAENADEFLGQNAYVWYQDFLNRFVFPNNILFGNAIMWGEIFLGLVLIVGGIVLYFYHKKWLHLVIAWASLGSFILILNIALSQGGLLPWLNPEEPYEEGVGLDTVILIVSLIVALANFSEADKEKENQLNNKRKSCCR